MSGPSLQPALGQRLREARRARGLKLAEVAAATGVSVSSLSLVETGKNEPTVGRLARLCTLYELSITELLPPTSPRKRGRTDAGLAFAGEGVTVTVLDAPAGGRMLPVALTFAPGGSFAEDVVVGSDVFLVVVEGTLEMSVRDGDATTLRPGDSVYFEPGEPHSYRNPSRRRRVRAIGVTSPPVPGPS